MSNLNSNSGVSAAPWVSTAADLGGCYVCVCVCVCVCKIRCCCCCCCKNVPTGRTLSADKNQNLRVVHWTLMKRTKRRHLTWPGAGCCSKSSSLRSYYCIVIVIVLLLLYCIVLYCYAQKNQKEPKGGTHLAGRRRLLRVLQPPRDLLTLQHHAHLGWGNERVRVRNER